MTTSVLERNALSLFALAALVAGCFAGCSIDEHGKRTCKGKDGYKGFCLAKDAGNGKDDAGRTDGGDAGDAGSMDGGDGGDAGDAGPDATYEDRDVGKPCERADPFVCFYGAAEQLTGACRAGTHKCNCPDGGNDCTEGTWGPCTGAIYPTAETCNGRDDDCDGVADNDVASGSCSVPEQQGACAQGVSECVNGVTVCTQTGEARPEVCNGMDDDCDGTPDDELQAVPCYEDGAAGCAFSEAEGRFLCKGTCAPGMQRCEDGKPGACENQVLPGAELCTSPGNLTANEDCDDATDEAPECACNEGANYPCYEGTAETANVAPCMMGTQTCTGGVLGSCVGQVVPALETCANDGVDNDCNGSPDDVRNRGMGCTDSAKKGRCRNGTRECAGGDLVCVTLEAIDEVCNGADDDCDGVIDDGFNFQEDENHCGACGIKCAAGETCCEGTCVDTQVDGNYCGSCGNRCSPGSKCCNGVCRNVLSDVNNCNTCNNVCPGLLSLLPVCCNGSCATVGCGG